jgi:hypothetical protein
MRTVGLILGLILVFILDSSRSTRDGLFPKRLSLRVKQSANALPTTSENLIASPAPSTMAIASQPATLSPTTSENQISNLAPSPPAIASPTTILSPTTSLLPSTSPSPPLVTQVPTNTTKKCAILFFGLARMFKEIVLPSINQYILEVNPSCDVYAHTYDINATTNSRNNEFNQPIHAHEVELISPNLTLVMDTEMDFEAKRNLTYFRQFFPVNQGWTYPTSMDNMIKQWHSIDRVWHAMDASGIAYERVGLFRLDVMYFEPMNVGPELGSAVIPAWGWWGGMNDRMFIGDYQYAEVHGCVVNAVQVAG